MNIDFNKLFGDKIAELEKEGFIEKLIAENVESTIKKAISEAFSSYKVHRKIEEKFEKEIDKSLDFLDLKGYNQFMVDKMNALLQTAKDVDLSNKVKTMMEKFLEPEAAELKFSKLMEEYREMLMEDEQYEYGDCFKVHIDDSFDLTTRIYVDEKQDSYSSKNHYSYKYYIKIDTKTKQIEQLKIDGVDQKGLLRFGFMDNFEGKLVRAYFNKTKIDIDCTEGDIDTSLYEEY